MRLCSKHLRWIVGVDLEGKSLPEGPMPIECTGWAAKHDPSDVAEFWALIRARAENILNMMTGNDGRTFESFISGAQQALAGFAFGRVSAVMRKSTFSMNDLKDGDKPTTLFVLADPSRMEAYKPYLGLIQWCAFTSIKRHKNKDRPVYAILDEATNYIINGLADLLTWGRGYGLRLHLIFQDFSAFERVYGQSGLETLLSETEVKQFLPGQRSPKTLEMIEKIIGQQSVISSSFADKDQSGGNRQSTSETARPVRTTDEIRRSKKGFLIIRDCLPIEFEPVSYAEISPWRKLVGINPFHGKPFLKRVKLKF
jgi:type IV secretion system protein VirD4